MRKKISLGLIVLTISLIATSVLGAFPAPRRDKSLNHYSPESRNELIEAIENEIARQGQEADLSNIDTSAIKNMSCLFLGKTDFNGNISAWDVSNVTDMNCMFMDALAFNGDISVWDVSNVKDMSEMFSGAMTFNQDISTWDVSWHIKHDDFSVNSALVNDFIPPAFR